MTNNISINSAATATNPYAMNTQSSMSNDVFGQKYFSGNPASFASQYYNQTAPKNRAQSIFQQYMTTAGATSAAPTVQDYYTASQIAGQFPASSQLPAMPTSFMQNDIFAQAYCQ